MPEKWILTFTELKALPKAPPLVRFDSKHKTFDFDVGNGLEHEGSYYWNDASDFATPAGIADSVRHLSEKVWFTGEHLRQLFLLLEKQR